jgi:hypothetical protein
MSRLQIVFNKLMAVLSVACLLAVCAPVAAHAAYDPFKPDNNDASVCTKNGAQSSICQAGTEDPIAGPNGAIIKATNILSAVAAIVAVIFVVWGGVKYVTSGGDSSGVASAKQTIIAALIGLILAFLARPIVSFVVTKL